MISQKISKFCKPHEQVEETFVKLAFFAVEIVQNRGRDLRITVLRD